MNFQGAKLFIFLCILHSSCSIRSRPEMEDVLSQHLEDGVVLTIPLNGCRGCVHEMLSFAKELQNNPSFVLILIGDVMKESSYVKKRDFKGAQNVHSYSISLLEKYSPETQYPAYYIIRKQRITAQMKIEFRDIPLAKQTILSSLARLEQ